MKRYIKSSDTRVNMRFVVVVTREDGSTYEAAWANDVDTAFTFAEDEVEAISSSNLSDEEKIAELISITVWDNYEGVFVADKDFAMFVKPYIQNIKYKKSEGSNRDWDDEDYDDYDDGWDDYEGDD